MLESLYEYTIYISVSINLLLDVLKNVEGMNSNCVHECRGKCNQKHVKKERKKNILLALVMLPTKKFTFLYTVKIYIS